MTDRTGRKRGDERTKRTESHKGKRTRRRTNINEIEKESQRQALFSLFSLFPFQSHPSPFCFILMEGDALQEEDKEKERQETDSQTNPLILD